MASAGARVIVEDGFLGGAASQQRWINALGDLHTLWVGVVCDEAVATLREKSRGNREAGMAAAQRLLVHRDIRYHYILDTTHAEPDVLAAKVISELNATPLGTPMTVSM